MRQEKKLYFRHEKLPIRLEVVRVVWSEGGVGSVYEGETIAMCELWYNKLDKELADLGGAKTL